MKKVVLASFLACSVLVLGLPFASAQDAAPAAAAAAPCQAGAQVQMPAPEYAVYNNAMTQTTPQAKAAGLEQYLTQFPQTCVKENTLESIMVLYYSFDHAKALDAADRVLQVNPTNIKALFVETLVRSEQAATVTDPTAKQAALDAAASFAQKGLAAPKPAGMSDADFTTLKGAQYPTFYSTIGYAAMNKNDAAAAIDAYKKELGSVSVEATKTPGAILQDTFYLGQEYMKSTPPDFLSCAFYTSRAVAYAPDSYKAIMSPTAKYCYRKYHGADDGYDAVMAAATANLNPPDGFAATVKPAPTPADIVTQVIASTPDLGTLAVGDKEFILQNGTPEQAAKVWDLLKGKSYQIDGTVISATPAQIQLAVSDDAKQSKVADFTINLTPTDDTSTAKLTPLQAKAAKAKADALTAATTVGATATVAGTYDSFTPNPIMITMKDGEVILPKAAAPKAATHTAAPVHRAAAAHH